MSKRKKIRNLSWVGVIVTLVIGLVILKNKPATINEATTNIPSIEKKVMVLNFDPILENYGGVRLHKYFNWNDPLTLEQAYISTMREVSHEYVNYRIVERQDIDNFPPGLNQFDDARYVACVADPTHCKYATMNYSTVLSTYQVCEKLNAGTIDELWIWGAPYFGIYEAIMTGPGAFYTNGPPVVGTTCKSKMDIMGFSYERGLAEMLENFGHRLEGTLSQVFVGGEMGLIKATDYNTSSNPWVRFLASDKYAPNKSGCGSIHSAPNSDSDYDWDNERLVRSYCIDFEHPFPFLEGDTQNVSCSTFGCSYDGLGFKKWWLSHLPHSEGTTNGKLNNWWRYLVGYDNAVSSQGENPQFVTVKSGTEDKNLACKLLLNKNEIYLGLNDRNVSDCPAGTPIKAVFDFSKINIDSKKNVTKAYLSFIQDGPYDNSLTLSIKLKYGTFTTSTATWVIDQHWEYKTRVMSPDLTKQLQEIVDQTLWKPGGTISAEISYVSGEGNRRVFAYERLGTVTTTALVYETSSTPRPSTSPSVAPSPSPSASPSPTASASPRTGPGDYSGDGCVTLKDYQLVMTNWGNPYTNADLQLIKVNFGKCY